MEQELTQERLKEVLKYDPISGAFYWVKTRGGCAIRGMYAGCIDRGKGYRRIMIDRKLYATSKLAWLYMTGSFPNGLIAHKNGVNSDDSWENLVEETASSIAVKNNINRGFEGITGVRQDPRSGSWVACIWVGSKQHLTSVKDKTEAVAHRLAAEQCLDWADGPASLAFKYMEEYIRSKK